MYHLPTTDPFVGPGELVLILDEGMKGRGKERDSGGRGTRGEGGVENREREGEEREEKWGERERKREGSRVGEGVGGGQREGENADIFFWCAVFLHLFIWAFTKQKL